MAKNVYLFYSCLLYCFNCFVLATLTYASPKKLTPNWDQEKERIKGSVEVEERQKLRLAQYSKRLRLAETEGDRYEEVMNSGIEQQQQQQKTQKLRLTALRQVHIHAPHTHAHTHTRTHTPPHFCNLFLFYSFTFSLSPKGEKEFNCTSSWKKLYESWFCFMLF